MGKGKALKVAMLLSGGVDSSVALGRLKEQGHDLTAYYLKIWLEDDLHSLGECPWEDDLKQARAVCEQFDVPLKVLPLQEQYWERVIAYVIEELKRGRTPSPDLFCNKHVKYGAFFEAIGDQYDKVASGHYASLKQVDDTFYLCRAKDPVKDQTYFLSHLDQQQLSRCLFPLGDMLKSEVRELADAWQLPNRQRPDSQGICFLGKIKYNDFVAHHLGEKPGAIIDKVSGKTLGQHKGPWFHTIGQRKGLGLSGGPWFVVDKSLSDNVVYVAHENHQKDFERRRFGAHKLHWIAGKPVKKGLQVKVRHGKDCYQCELDDSPTGGLTISLDSVDAGLAAGQFAVFYDQDVCLGNGTIH